MTQTSSQDVSSNHEEQLMILVYYLTGCRPVGTAPWTCRLFVFPLLETEKKTGHKNTKNTTFLFFLLCTASCDAMCVSAFVLSVCQVHWVQIGTFPRVYGFSGTCFSFLQGPLGARWCPYMWLAVGSFRRHFECDVEVTSRLEVGWGLVGGWLGL